VESEDLGVRAEDKEGSGGGGAENDGPWDGAKWVAGFGTEGGSAFKADKAEDGQ